MKSVSASLLIGLLALSVQALASVCQPLPITTGPSAYYWIPPAAGEINSLGSLRLGLALDLRRTITFKPVASPARLVDLSCPTDPRERLTRLKFQSAAQTFTVSVKLTSNALDLESTDLAVTSLAIGPWPAGSNPQDIAVPYDSDPVVYLQTPHLFTNVYLDWQHTSATKLKPLQATYSPLTDGRYKPFKDRIIVKASEDFDRALPDINNPPSPFISSLAGRVVLDVWGPRFSKVTANLNKLHAAGLGDCVLILHVWQKYGYDNGLPTHYPANSELGGDEALKAAVTAGKDAGCLVALHENYVDDYPNSDSFQPSQLAQDSGGAPQKAWFNQGANLQSFGTKPTMFVANASSQSPEIHRRYGTTASFLDVNSAVDPGDWRVDMDSSQPGAGTLAAVVKASGDLWNFERKTHAGPVLGEGNKHWFWSGLLDGVEAQFGAANIPIAAPDRPLFVDFDLLKIHPLIVNHGMGYYDRWLPVSRKIWQDDLLDTYRMQEVIFGHSPFIGTDLWESIPEVIKEQNLIGPLARRYGTQTVTSIKYQINGNWTDTNQAIQSHDWRRPLVTYANGDQLVANAGPGNLSWQGLTIPIHGWAAKGPGLLAYTAFVDGQLADYSQTSASFFANARNQKDREDAGALAEPVVIGFQQLSPRTISLQIRWAVKSEVSSEALKMFVHVVDARRTENEAISWQASASTSVPTNHWKPGRTVTDTPFSVAIPQGTSDGSYLVKVGLFSPTTGQRASLAGQNDGAFRYVVGTLLVSDSAAKITFQPLKQTNANPPPKPVNFGNITTDGMVSLSRIGGEWNLRTYPLSRTVLVRLQSSAIAPPRTIACDAEPTAITPQRVGESWEIHLSGQSLCKWTAKP